MLYKYRLHWSMHPDKDESWYHAQKNRMTPDEIARELDIEYSLSVSGRVFSSFNERKHVLTTAIPVQPEKPIYRIWDFGRTNAVLYGQYADTGHRRLFHERILTGSTTLEQVTTALDDSFRLFPNHLLFYDICDPAGHYDDGRGKDTHVEILNQHHIFPHFQAIQRIPSKDRKKRARTMLELDLQRCPGGDDAFALYVSTDRQSGCPTLLRAFQGGYSYKTDLNGNVLDVIDEKHPFEDVMDCLLYWYLETRDATKHDTLHYKAYSPNDQFNPYTGY
jgi:hypothetical protein